VLTLMVRAVVEGDARRKNKALQRARRKARLSWHPITLGRNFGRLPIYHTSNPAFKPAPPLPQPQGLEKKHDEEGSVDGVRLVTDMDLSPLVDGIRTTSFAGRLPVDPASRPRPNDYIPPKLAVILRQIELEGTSWYDHMVIGAAKVRAKIKEQRDKSKQRRLKKLKEQQEGSSDSNSEDDEENESDEYESEESEEGSDEESEQSRTGWLPKLMKPAHRLAEALKSSPFTPFKSEASVSDSSSRPGTVDEGSVAESFSTSGRLSSKAGSSRLEKDSETTQVSSKSAKSTSKKLALTPEEKRKKSEVARASFVDVSGFPLDSASLSLELACPLPPRFRMVPNPMHEDNMHPVKRAIHQA
jgi:hypothetical protein